MSEQTGGVFQARHKPCGLDFRKIYVVSFTGVHAHFLNFWTIKTTLEQDDYNLCIEQFKKNTLMREKERLTDRPTDSQVGTGRQTDRDREAERHFH